MKKLFFKRVISAMMMAVIVLSSVLGNGNSASAETTGQDYSKLLYGGDTTEYYLGIAAHFSLFGMNVTIRSGNDGNYSDCDGRIAADEFSVESWTNGKWGYPIKGLLSSTDSSKSSKAAVNGAASVICNNATSKTFGYIDPGYNEQGTKNIYVVSDQVTSLRALPNGVSGAQEYYNQLNARLVKVPANSLINFSNEMNTLRTKSNELANTTANGTVKTGNGRIVLEGKGNTDVFYFRMTEAQWKTANNGLTLNIPNGAFAIISVEGKNVTISGGQTDMLYLGNAQVTQNGTENGRILFNFFQAETVTICGGARGCILAPNAAVSDKNAYVHHAAQIIGKTVKIKGEMGRFGFMLRKKCVQEPTYTAHYMYYGTDGQIHEIPSAVYKLFIGKNKAPMPNNGVAGYKKGNSITANNGSNLDTIKAAFAASDMAYYAELLEKGCSLKFEVYEDGKQWQNALSGTALTDSVKYDAMTRKNDIDWTTKYTFGSSNVYFILYPTAKVTVDVKWDDKQNKSGERPAAGNFGVALNEKAGSAVTKCDSVQPLSEKAVAVTEYDSSIKKNVVYDQFTSKYTFEVPILGKQAKTGASYSADAENFGENGLFDIAYTVPAGYNDTTVTKVTADGTVDENGVVAQYHIVLRKEYIATFYIIDPDGNRTEVFKQNFYDADEDDYVGYLGAATTGKLPKLTYDEIATCLGDDATNSEYTIVWRDVKTGKLYTPGKDKYTFDYEDAEFETLLRLTTITEGQIPWLYCDIISFNGSNYIPGSMVYSRLTLDKNSDEYAFIQKKNNTRKAASTPIAYDEELKEGQHKDDQFFLVALAYGVDQDRAAYSRITISNEGYGKDAAIFYETQNNSGCVDSFCAMPGNKGTKASTYQEMIPEDPYLNDYEGINITRLVIPAEYVNETLYVTAYYTDENGHESVWFYYHFNLGQNKFWTVK